MQWKPKQVILMVYFMYTVNEMRLGELAKTVFTQRAPHRPTERLLIISNYPFPTTNWDVI